jgi:hypothetical protein
MHLSGCLATDRESILDHESSLTEGEGIALDRVGVIYLHHPETLLELSELSLGEWSHRLYLLDESIYLGHEGGERRGLHG